MLGEEKKLKNGRLGAGGNQKPKAKTRGAFQWMLAATTLAVLLLLARTGAPHSAPGETSGARIIIASSGRSSDNNKSAKTIGSRVDVERPATHFLADVVETSRAKAAVSLELRRHVQDEQQQQTTTKGANQDDDGHDARRANVKSETRKRAASWRLGARDDGPMINGQMVAAVMVADGAVGERTRSSPADMIEAHITKRSQKSRTSAAATTSNKLAGRQATMAPAVTTTVIGSGRRAKLEADAAPARLDLDEPQLIDYDSKGAEGSQTRALTIEGGASVALKPTQAAASARSTTTTTTRRRKRAVVPAKPAGQKEKSSLKCRLEKDLYLDFEEYRHYTCAHCYNQVPAEYFENKLTLVKLQGGQVKLYDGKADEFVWPNASQRIRRTFKDQLKFEKWRICCQDAIVCCLNNWQHVSKARDPSGRFIDDPQQLDECPGTWDGLSCWPPSAAGQLAWHTCPRAAYLLDFEPACRGYVTKQCFSNASWFINRNGHEWSDYSTCSPERLYTTRMLHALTAYICEALVVLPALLIIDKFPNRRGNKRIRIMKSLLFYILLNSLIQAAQRGFFATNFFAEYRVRPDRPTNSTTDVQRAADGMLYDLALYQDDAPTLTTSPRPPASSNASASNRSARSIGLLEAATTYGVPAAGADEEARASALVDRIFEEATSPHDLRPCDSSGGVNLLQVAGWPETGWHSDKSRTTVMPTGNLHERSASSRARHKRNPIPASNATEAPTRPRDKSNRTLWKAFLCWSLQIAGRLARLMGYAWMFTGGVYLCSALHFAPAEPPIKFIRILFILTNVFPTLTFIAYVTARSLSEPSPLNILLKAPYHWANGEEEALDNLLAVHRVCWFKGSKDERIEQIADLPNLILVVSNVILFVATLVFLCRISRPGSTRADMSPCAYFRAAGTLLFLYGGHYFFLAYRPYSRNCSIDIFMFYAFICIDVVQGVAISVVFCYMTQEGKMVIVKFWRSRHRLLLVRQFTWMGCVKDKDEFAENGYHHSSLHTNNRSNQSTRTNNSVCDGHNDTVTELMNINDNVTTELMNVDDARVSEEF